MNLTMSEGPTLRLFICQVVNTHGDHSRLFFLDIDEFNQTFLAALIEVPLHRSIGSVLLQDLLDVVLVELECVVLAVDNEQRPLNSTRVSAELDLAP